MLEQFLKLCNFPDVLVKNVVFLPYESGIFLNVIDPLMAKWLLLKIPTLERAMRQLELDALIIAIKGDIIWRVSLDESDISDRTLKKKAQELMQTMIKPANLIEIDIDTLDLSRPHSILTELHSLKYPAYITFLGSEETPFYNQVDALRMSNAPVSMLVTSSRVLTYPEELEARNRLLRTDGRLKDYAYKGLRWYKDGEMWRRKEVSIVANYSLCEFMGQPARIGIVKEEDELRKFRD